MEFLERAKTIQNKITDALAHDDITNMTNLFDELDSVYRSVNVIMQDVKLIRQNCQMEIISRLKKIRCDIEILNNDTPTAEDIQLLHSRTHGQQEVAAGISLPVVTVATEDFIPSTPLYYVRATDEFACRINGTLIHGRIKEFTTGANAIRCRRGAACHTANCTWGHPTATSDSGAPRALHAWSSGAWLHTDRAITSKNVHMRHIGSRATLLADIDAATRAELTDRQEQTAHDLLIALAIAEIKK